MLVGEELFGAVETVSALPELVDAVSQRGIDPDYAICLPRTIGRFYADTAEPVNHSLADCPDLIVRRITPEFVRSIAYCFYPLRFSLC